MLSDLLPVVLILLKNDLKHKTSMVNEFSICRLLKEADQKETFPFVFLFYYYEKTLSEGLIRTLITIYGNNRIKHILCLRFNLFVCLSVPRKPSFCINYYLIYLLNFGFIFEK